MRTTCSPEVNASPRVIGLVNGIVLQGAALLICSLVLFSLQYVISNIHDGKIKTMGHIPRQSFVQRAGPLPGMGGGRVMNYQLYPPHHQLLLPANPPQDPASIVCWGFNVALFVNFQVFNILILV